MENVFVDYSKYYDLLYRSKNYAGEVKYVEDVIKKHGIPNSKILIDLGCGTGNHSLILSKNGWTVTGIDRSESMLHIARQKAKENNLKVNFLHGELSNCEIQEDSSFDVAISMFAVIGYLTESKSLLHLFTTINKILKPGGLFIFDCWFGPAVLSNRSTDSYKFVEENEIRVIRFTHSELHPLKNVIDVNFHIIEIQKNQIKSEVKETHPMRFFFTPEIEMFFNHSGMDLVATYPFMKLNMQANENDQNVLFVGRKK